MSSVATDGDRCGNSDPVATSEQSDGAAKNAAVNAKSMLLLKTTPLLRKYFDEHIPKHTYQEAFPASLLDDSSLGLSDLKTLLQGTRVYFQPKPDKVVNEQYQERMRLLRERLDEESYQRMVSGGTNFALAETRNDLRELRNQLSTIVNVIISIFTAAMASWYWTTSWTTGSRVLSALGSAIGLGAIEAFLYFRYRAKIEQGKHFEAQTKSRSRVKNMLISGMEETKKSR